MCESDGLDKIHPVQQHGIKVTLQLLCFGLLHTSEGFGDRPCMMSQRVTETSRPGRCFTLFAQCL